MALVLTGLAELAVTTGLAGCGATTQIPGDRVPGDQIPGGVLTFYASIPLRGASSVIGMAVLNGERMALEEVRGRIGRYRIALVPLDDATIARDGWDPGQTTANARLAVQNRTTIGYLGDLNSGASAVSIPLLNHAGIAQISPASTAVGLTVGGPGSSPGEPQKYYPSGGRTFARVVPSYAVQAVAQARLQSSVGCTSTFVVDDDEVDGQDTAASFEAVAQSLSLKIAGTQSFEPGQTGYRPLAAVVASTRADCVLISAITEDAAARVVRGQLRFLSGSTRKGDQPQGPLGQYGGPPMRPMRATFVGEVALWLGVSGLGAQSPAQTLLRSGLVFTLLATGPLGRSERHQEEEREFSRQGHEGVPGLGNRGGPQRLWQQFQQL